MHAILCVSARHLSFLFPKDSNYASHAAIHLSQTLRLFRGDLFNRLSPANADAFMATASLLQFDIWTNTDFVSIDDNGCMEFDPTRDRILQLGLGAMHIFTNSMPHAFDRASVFVSTFLHSPREVLVQAAQLSNSTLERFTLHFAYDRPLGPHLFQLPLPFLRDEDLAPQESFAFRAWKGLNHDGEPLDSYSNMMHRLCLLMSFLPEAQDDCPRLTPDLLSDFSRYIFTFTIMLDKHIVQMMNQSDPKLLFLLYHFYRTVRISLSATEFWWAQKRALMSEIGLRGLLEKEVAKVTDATTYRVCEK
jgi:hypothetical protein